MNNMTDILWDEAPVDVTQESNFIWSIANKIRGDFKEDQYGDVIIPMTVLRRFECTLEATKEKVLNEVKAHPTAPAKLLYKLSGYQFYNTSNFNLKELCNDPDHIAENLKAYVTGFSSNVIEIFNGLDLDAQINKMEKGGCLYTVVKAFSELELNPAVIDSIKMGYIFENLIGRFFQNEGQGQYYTGRDIIKCMMSILISEGCEDIFDDSKEITVLDQAAGTSGMLSIAYSYLKHYNPSCNVRLFGQEYNGISHAVGLAEMLIKGQNADNYRHADTFKEDCFPEVKMRFILENPPFGTPWGGENAKEGQEKAVREEFAKGEKGRWGTGLPSTSDGQLLFVQSAINKMASNGRAAIIENGSPLFTGGTSSGESQIRRWILENDLLEAIIGLPTDLFYNTGIATYIWVLSKKKREERVGKIQLIDATEKCHKLRKNLGQKKVEITPEDRVEITKLYTDFKENEFCQIYDNTEFMYREYTIMQPLQRSYSITDESIERMLQSGALSGLWDEDKVSELENQGNAISGKDEKKLYGFYETKPLFDAVLAALKANVSDKKWLSPEAFKPVLKMVLANANDDKKLLEKIEKGLSVMDKSAVVQKDKKGNIVYDKETKDIEIVRYDEDIEDYMAREVLPHVPDAKWFWEEDLGAKKPVIKVGAEIPFTRYFYKYHAPTPSEELKVRFTKLELSVSERVAKLFGEV